MEVLLILPRLCVHLSLLPLGIVSEVLLKPKAWLHAQEGTDPRLKQKDLLTCSCYRTLGPPI